MKSLRPSLTTKIYRMLYDSIIKHKQNNNVQRKESNDKQNIQQQN